MATATNGTPEANDATAEAQPTAGSKIPSWIKAEIFEDMLKKNISGYRKTKNFKATPALGAGENYATVMLRIEIEYELDDGSTKTLPLMLKVPHSSELYQQMMASTNIFEIERRVYLEIIPEIEQMYRDVGLSVKFTAESYEINPGVDYVLLEDLSPRGFKNANRLEGLDQTHIEMCLKRLAQWHAATATRVEIKGKYPTQLANAFFTEDKLEMFRMMIDGMAKDFRQCLKTFEGNEIYYDQVVAIQPKMVDEIFKMAKVDSNEFNALNHGDFWSNNIMFQYDAFGKIKETYFVDFQMPKYGSVTQDLLYFLLSSTKLELKINKFDYFIKYYHDNLIEYLKLLKYPKKLPALKDIHTQLFKYGLFGFMTVTGILGAVLLDPTEQASFDNMMNESSESNNFKMLMYTNQRYRNHMAQILPWMLNRGVFEI